MKILVIRLKNLASVEGEFGIDFTGEPLHSAGIFAISGATGAGKSTLLDALCLALYDRTPRFSATGESLMLKDVGDSQINQSDVRNILRRGTADGYAEVEFRAVTGDRYRSRWSVRRARNVATGSLRPQELQVVCLENDEVLQGTKKELLAQLARLTGLTYEQFTRTVLLAQNDFATFLKSRESAKAELLEKLTGTGIYSAISREIYQRSKHADEELHHLKEGLRLIELLPEEEVERLKKEQLSLAVQRKETREVLERWKEHLKDLQTLQVQTEARTVRQKQVKEEIQRLQQAQEQLQKHVEGMSHFRAQCEALQPDLRKARELDVRIGGLQKNHTEAEQSWQMVYTQREQLEKTLIGKKKECLQYVHSLSACRDEEWLKKYDLWQQREKEQKQEASDSLFDLPVATESLTDLSPLSENTPVARQLLFLEELSRRYNWLLECLVRQNELQVERLNSFGIHTLGEEQRRYNTEWNRLQEARQQTLQWIRAQEEVIRITAEHDQLDTRLTAAEKELTDSEQQWQLQVARLQMVQRLYDNARLSISENVHTLRTHLQFEQPCPVCGSTEHPYHTEDSKVEILFGQIETEYRQVAEEHRVSQEKVIAFRQNITNLREQLKQYATQLSLRREEAQRLCPVKEERKTEYFDQQIARVKEELDKIAVKLKSYQQLHQEWQTQDAKVKQLRGVCERLQQGISQCHLWVQQVETDRERLSLTVAHEDTMKERLVRAKEELEKVTLERKALLKGMPADDAENNIRLKEAKLNEILETMKREVEQIQGRLSGLQGELRQIDHSIAELDRRSRSAEVPPELPQAVRTQEKLLSEMERNLSATEARLLQHQQNQTRIRQAEKGLKEREQIADKWGKLNKLLGSADGHKFKVIAQSYTLNILLMHANTHLNYLSRRYRLQQVPGTLALQVIDRDMCDEVRTVYSLSGGESFLISLALALGLSSLSSNNLKVESLFIDEGFGSLDADSLRTAMEALEQLQMQGRKIGVISHVQEMSERIAVQIQLHKAVNGKSRIVIKGGKF